MSPILLYTDKYSQIWAAVEQLARDCANAHAEPVHLGFVLLNEGGGQNSLFASSIQKAGGDLTVIRQELLSAIVRLPLNQPPPDKPLGSAASVSLFVRAHSLRNIMGDSYLGQDHLLLALFKDPSLKAIVEEANLTEVQLETAFNQFRGNRRIDSTIADRDFGPQSSSSLQPGFGALPKYVVDLTTGDGKIDPVIRRDDDIRRIAHILRRRTKNNPVLVGELGVGKAGVVEELAQRMKSDDAFRSLGRLVTLDMEALRSGTNCKADREEHLKLVLNEIEEASQEDGGVILFIDDLHLMMDGSGGSLQGAAELLKPILARGKLRCIGTTTAADYHKYITKDAAFERLFSQVLIDEPTVPETINILRSIREKYQVHHGVQISDDALISAATLAHRYLTSRKLPDSAIDLIDEACASIDLTPDTVTKATAKLKRRKSELKAVVQAFERQGEQASAGRLAVARKAIADIEDQLRQLLLPYQNGGRGTITPQQICEIVARMTSIPATSLMLSEKEKLLDLEKVLSKSVFGQPEAIKAVANAIRLSRSGLQNAGRPVASFLMAGTLGTGKTLLSKTLATVLFDSPDQMIKIYSSECTESHSISRLIGSPLGCVGCSSEGQLTEYVRHKPHCIVFIDEIEKACREFIILLLHVLEDGRLTDSRGRVVDFRNTVIIMTSNLGADHLRKMGEGRVKLQTKDLVMRSIRGQFPPAFINRIDDIVIFRNLSRITVKKIVDMRLKEVQDRLVDRKMTLNIDEDAKSFLYTTGYSLIYETGALNRTIQNNLLNPLATMILSGQVCNEEIIRVAFDDLHKRLVIVPNHAGTATENDSMDDEEEDGNDDDSNDEERFSWNKVNRARSDEERVDLDNVNRVSNCEEKVDWNSINRVGNATWPPLNVAGSLFRTFLQ